LVSPSRPEAWAEAIYRACTNEDAQQNLTKAARSVFSRHDPEAATRGFWDAIAKLMSGSQKTHVSHV
jgi:hypothetical protein